IVDEPLLANRVAFARRTATELDRAGLRRRVALRACLPAGVRYGVERNRDAGRRLVVRAEIRNGRRVVAVVVREVGFLRGDEIAEVRLHRGDVRLFLRVGELRNRDRGKNADDDDDDQQLDEGEALLVTRHRGTPWGYDGIFETIGQIPVTRTTWTSANPLPEFWK